MEKAFLQGPDEWSRYKVLGVPYDTQKSRKLYDAGYEAVKLPDGYLITPGIPADRDSYCRIFSSILEADVRVLHLIEGGAADSIELDSLDSSQNID